MITAMLSVFILGYILIALEHKTNINKTAVALTLGMLLWTMYIFAGPTQIIAGAPVSFHDFILQHPDYTQLSLLKQVQKYVTGLEIIDQLGNISEILFYLLGAMTIVEAIDIHNGFSLITDRIKTRGKKKITVVGCLYYLFHVIHIGQHDLSHCDDDDDPKAIDPTQGTLDIRKHYHYCRQCRRSMDSHRRCYDHYAMDQRKYLFRRNYQKSVPAQYSFTSHSSMADVLFPAWPIHSFSISIFHRIPCSV